MSLSKLQVADVAVRLDLTVQLASVRSSTRRCPEPPACVFAD
jgi:hypothetical protein